MAVDGATSRVVRGPATARSMARIIVTYVRPSWSTFLLATLAALVKAFAPMVVVWVVAQTVDELSTMGRGEVSGALVREAILEYVLIGLIAFVVAVLPTYWRDALPGRAVREIGTRIQRDLYTHLHRMPQSFFDGNHSGALASRMVGDVAAIEPFIARGFVQFPMAAAVLVGVLGYFFFLDPSLALVSIALLPVQIVAMTLIATRAGRENCRLLALRNTYSDNMQEKLAAISMVKAYTHEGWEVDRFVKDSEPILTIGVRLARLSGTGQVVSQSLAMLSSLSFVVAGAYLATRPDSTITIGVLLQFVFMHARVLQPLTWILDMQPILAAALAGADRVYDILDRRPAVRDRPDAVSVAPSRGEIRFDQVSFAFPGTSELVVDELDLHVPAHSSLALVGASGSGKTTLTTLMFRFYDVTSGAVTVDGLDVRDYDAIALRSSIALVPREPVLLSGTVLENILFGRPDATRAEVRHAAVQAYAHGFISCLDHGYDEVIGERGTTLSGDQRQRIAIARAFLKDPAIIVLDEPTSALDTRSEAIVGRALRALMTDRTTIIIAHRLSTVRDADNIVVLDHGRIAEQGSHADLMVRGGAYANLYSAHEEPPHGADDDADDQGTPARTFRRMPGPSVPDRRPLPERAERPLLVHPAAPATKAPSP